MDKLIQTKNDQVLAIMRITLGVVIFGHGAQKMLGWFGGSGFSGTISALGEFYGVPAALAFLVIIAEFFGSLGLITGTLTRVAAAGIVPVMLGAIFIAHAQVGFFMNWTGSQQGEGFEYHLLVLAMTAVLIVKGGGALSIDRFLSARRQPAS